ncbi:MAG: serine/threonine-protein kinase [Nitrospirota bacterium]
MTKLLKNRYEITGTLGQGGMGSVYKVADRSARGKVLAVKELRTTNQAPNKATESIALFRTEALILSRLTHPNLPKVTDYFSFGGSHYIVMEYVQGRTLEQLLNARRGKVIDERLALSWGLQICRAMQFLSVQKPRPVVFRDLKPSNIMIDRTGRVKLIDFGIARFFKEDKQEDTYVYGTPGYAAPEQYGTGQTDVRSDIFSLGATLHHCLTGRDPSAHPLDFPDPLLLNPKLNKGTAKIIKKALDLDAQRRYQSALAMKQAIQSVLQNLETLPKGVDSVIHAVAGKPINLPWWRKTSWVSMPVMALGCNGTTGTLSSHDRWLHPKPRAFSHAATQLLFRVDAAKLRMGREYRPTITVHTDAGILRPQLSFKRPWPWLLIDSMLIAAAIAGVLMMR